MLRSDLEKRIGYRELLEWIFYDEYVLEMQEKGEGRMKAKAAREKKVIEKKMSVEEAKAEARLDSANLAQKLKDAERKAGIY